MEFFGILFSLPLAFVLSAVYCAFISRFVREFERARKLFYSCSIVLLTFFGIELALLCGFGAVRSRAVLGPAFSVAHIAFFFLGTPALCNVLVLARRQPVVANLYVAAAICAFFAMFLVIVQYGVAEALYGANGKDGPYS